MIVVLLGLLTAFIGGIVFVLGWWLGVDALTFVLPGAVTMKPTTAASLLCLGLATLRCVPAAASLRNAWSGALTTTGSVLAGGLHAGTLLEQALAIPLGFDHLFAREAPGAALSVAPGVPSLFTSAATLALACGLMVATHSPSADLSRSALYRAGWVSMSVGVSALLGYGSGAPLLYGFIPGVSSAVAIHTAAALLALGLAQVLASERIMKGTIR